MNSPSGEPLDQSPHLAAQAVLDQFFGQPGPGVAPSAAAAWATVKKALHALAAQNVEALYVPQPSDTPYDEGMKAARSGVQDVVPGFGDLPFEDYPAEWLDKPVARIRWFHQDGNAAAGLQDVQAWTLDGDQHGTLLAELVERFAMDFGPCPSPADLIADLAGSTWLQDALQEALARDPMDAANDAAVLARVLSQHARQVLEAAQKNGQGPDDIG